jgi:hypothetical protein
MMALPIAGGITAKPNLGTAVIPILMFQFRYHFQVEELLLQLLQDNITHVQSSMMALPIAGGITTMANLEMVPTAKVILLPQSLFLLEGQPH